jgi:hypothetical protein
MFRRTHHSSTAALTAAWLLIAPLGSGVSLAEYALLGRIEVSPAAAIDSKDPAASTGSVTPEQALRGLFASQPERSSASEDSHGVGSLGERGS